MLEMTCFLIYASKKEKLAFLKLIVVCLAL